MSIQEQVETHLRQALKADSAEKKNHHIRHALQIQEGIQTEELQKTDEIR